MSGKFVQMNVRMPAELRARVRTVGLLPEFAEGGASAFVRECIEAGLARRAGLFESTEPPSVNREVAPSGDGGGSVDPAAAGVEPVGLADWILERDGRWSRGALNFKILSGAVLVGGAPWKELEVEPGRLGQGVMVEGEVIL